MPCSGGASGIGPALAEVFLDGNRVIIASRRAEVMDEVTVADPGMKSMALDIGDAKAIRQFAHDSSRCNQSIEAR